MFEAVEAMRQGAPVLHENLGSYEQSSYQIRMMRPVAGSNVASHIKVRTGDIAEGFQAAAVSGKPSAEKFLRGLGAASVLPRSEVQDTSSRPLLAARWAGAVDTVGGNTLATVLRSMGRAGCAAACGLVGGTELNLTVYPFILRGVALVGIDSAECPTWTTSGTSSSTHFA